MQVEHRDRIEEFGLNENVAQDYLINMDMMRHMRFNSTRNIYIQREGDSISSFLLKLNMGALPYGWRYKRCYTNYLIKNVEISIGGSPIWKSTGDWLKMKQLIFENQNKELIFDYDDEMRTRLSAQNHEVVVEPINLKDELIMNTGIPLLCLAFGEVRIKFEFGELIDCIERYCEVPEMLNPDNNIYILDSAIIRLVNFFDTAERRRLFHEMPYRKVVKINNTVSNIATKDMCIFDHNPNLVCSGAYIHITDVNGNEVPRQVVKNIRVEMNGAQRLSISGFSSRHLIRNNMPHPTKSNNESQNLYYISYWPGRNAANGAEYGLNCINTEGYKIILEYEDWVPDRFKVVINHRTQNLLVIAHGMGGLHIMPGRIVETDIPRPVVQEIQFQNTDQLINILADDMCMISQNTFEEGDQVDKCNGCKKVFNTLLLKEWYRKTPRNNWKCLNCMTIYNSDTFKRGKAHIVEEMMDEERLPLIERRQNNVLQRIVQALIPQNIHNHLD